MMTLAKAGKDQSAEQKGVNNRVRKPQPCRSTERCRLSEVCAGVRNQSGYTGHSCAYSQRHDQHIPELQRSGQPNDDVGSRLEPKDQFSKLLASFLINSRCCVMYSWTTCRASIIRGSRSPCCAASEAGASCLCRMVARIRFAARSIMQATLSLTWIMSALDRPEGPRPYRN
jgi:hypothetical protein